MPCYGSRLRRTQLTGAVLLQPTDHTSASAPGSVQPPPLPNPELGPSRGPSGRPGTAPTRQRTPLATPPQPGRPGALSRRTVPAYVKVKETQGLSKIFSTAPAREAIFSVGPSLWPTVQMSAQTRGPFKRQHFRLPGNLRKKQSCDRCFIFQKILLVVQKIF